MIENLMGNFDVTNEEKKVLKDFIADNGNLDIYYDSYENAIRGVMTDDVYDDPERYDLITIALTNFFDTMLFIVTWAYEHNYEIKTLRKIDGRYSIENTGTNEQVN